MLPNTSLQVPNLATALDGPLGILEETILKQQCSIEAWLRRQWQKSPPPFYGSVDLRNAGFKLAPVDTNLFPAGFNNLNPDLLPLCIQAVQATMAETCPDATRLLLIPESHSRNTFYFESLAMLNTILQKAGYEVRFGSLDNTLTEPRCIELPSGKKITLEPLIRKGDEIGVTNFFPCCIILNNDLSDGIPDLLKGIKQTLFPSAKLGWAHRLKSEHFNHYQQVSEEFAKHIGIDPWLISPLFNRCANVDFMKSEGLDCLADNTAQLIQQIQKKYDEYHIEQKPFVVIKADAGTYGMAVMMVHDAQELKSLNRKQRTKMATVKGGASVNKAIIQEGVYTFETLGEQHTVAEPVVYLIGRHVVGGFYRLHKNRGINENLNAPGMDFQPLAFVDSCNNPKADKNCPTNRFYTYGVLARMAILAAARELQTIEQKK